MIILSLGYIYIYSYYSSHKDKKKTYPKFVPILKKVLMITGLNLLVSGIYSIIAPYGGIPQFILIISNILTLILLLVPSSVLYYHWIFKEKTTTEKAIIHSSACALLSNSIIIGYILISLFGTVIITIIDFVR